MSYRERLRENKFSVKVGWIFSVNNIGNSFDEKLDLQCKTDIYVINLVCVCV